MASENFSFRVGSSKTSKTFTTGDESEIVRHSSPLVAVLTGFRIGIMRATSQAPTMHDRYSSDTVPNFFNIRIEMRLVLRSFEVFTLEIIFLIRYV